jgi:hypothetical protein
VEKRKEETLEMKKKRTNNSSLSFDESGDDEIIDEDIAVEDLINQLQNLVKTKSKIKIDPEQQQQIKSKSIEIPPCIKFVESKNDKNTEHREYNKHVDMYKTSETTYKDDIYSMSDNKMKSDKVDDKNKNNNNKKQKVELSDIDQQINEVSKIAQHKHGYSGMKGLGIQTNIQTILKEKFGSESVLIGSNKEQMNKALKCGCWFPSHVDYLLKIFEKFDAKFNRTQLHEQDYSHKHSHEHTFKVDYTNAMDVMSNKVYGNPLANISIKIKFDDLNKSAEYQTIYDRLTPIVFSTRHLINILKMFSSSDFVKWCTEDKTNITTCKCGNEYNFGELNSSGLRELFLMQKLCLGYKQLILNHSKLFVLQKDIYHMHDDIGIMPIEIYHQNFPVISTDKKKFRTCVMTIYKFIAENESLKFSEKSVSYEKRSEVIKEENKFNDKKRFDNVSNILDEFSGMFQSENIQTTKHNIIPSATTIVTTKNIIEELANLSTLTTVENNTNIQSQNKIQTAVSLPTTQFIIPKSNSNNEEKECIDDRELTRENDESTINFKKPLNEDTRKEIFKLKERMSDHSDPLLKTCKITFMYQIISKKISKTKKNFETIFETIINKISHLNGQYNINSINHLMKVFDILVDGLIFNKGEQKNSKPEQLFEDIMDCRTEQLAQDNVIFYSVPPFDSDDLRDLIELDENMKQFPEKEKVLFCKNFSRFPNNEIPPDNIGDVTILHNIKQQLFSSESPKQSLNEVHNTITKFLYMFQQNFSSYHVDLGRCMLLKGFYFNS